MQITLLIIEQAVALIGPNCLSVKFECEARMWSDECEVRMRSGEDKKLHMENRNWRDLFRPRLQEEVKFRTAKATV